MRKSAVFILALASSFPTYTMAQKLTSVLPIDQIRQKTEDNYDKIYPFYIESCSMTPFHRFDGNDSGGSGHAVSFVKGLCREVDAPYPRVKVCVPGQYTAEQEASGVGYNDFHNPNAGLGFSVNREFRSVNWIAIPGKDLFFKGGLGAHDLVTTESLKTIGARLYQLRTHKGVVPTEKALTHWDKQMPLEQFLAQYSVNLDVGTGLGRYLHCVRVPIKQEMLPPVVEYLNGLNDHYAKTLDFDWSAFNDNCTHLVDNILASVGFMSHKDTTPGYTGFFKKLIAPIDLAVPADSLFHIAVQGNWLPLGEVLSAFNTMAGRRSLFANHWIATQHGTLVTVAPPHEQATNKVFKVSSDQAEIFMAERALGFDHLAYRLALDPDFADIRANLEYFKGRYQKFLSQPHPLDTAFTWFIRDDRSMVELTLRQQMQTQLSDADEKLKQVFSLGLN